MEGGGEIFKEGVKKLNPETALLRIQFSKASIQIREFWLFLRTCICWFYIYIVEFIVYVSI